jgi:antitoxin component of MazEF toxin-antitoxin module
MSNKKTMAKVKFISTISKMGDDRVIRIPRKVLKAMSVMEGKDIRVICDDEF